MSVSGLGLGLGRLLSAPDALEFILEIAEASLRPLVASLRLVMTSVRFGSILPELCSEFCDGIGGSGGGIGGSFGGLVGIGGGQEADPHGLSHILIGGRRSYCWWCCCWRWCCCWWCRCHCC